MDENGNFVLKTDGFSLEATKDSGFYTGTLNSTQLDKVKRIFDYIANEKNLNSDSSYKLYYDYCKNPSDENTRGILYATLKGIGYITFGSDGPFEGLTYEEFGNSEIDLALGWLK